MTKTPPPAPSNGTPLPKHYHIVVRGVEKPILSVSETFEVTWDREQYPELGAAIVAAAKMIYDTAPTTQAEMCARCETSPVAPDLWALNIPQCGGCYADDVLNVYTDNQRRPVSGSPAYHLRQPARRHIPVTDSLSPKTPLPCPTCETDGQTMATAFDHNCPAAWAHKYLHPDRGSISTIYPRRPLVAPGAEPVAWGIQRVTKRFMDEVTTLTSRRDAWLKDMEPGQRLDHYRIVPLYAAAPVSSASAPLTEALLDEAVKSVMSCATAAQVRSQLSAYVLAPSPAVTREAVEALQKWDYSDDPSPFRHDLIESSAGRWILTDDIRALFATSPSPSTRESVIEECAKTAESYAERCCLTGGDRAFAAREVAINIRALATSDPFAISKEWSLKMAEVEAANEAKAQERCPSCGGKNVQERSSWVCLSCNLLVREGVAASPSPSIRETAIARIVGRVGSCILSNSEGSPALDTTMEAGGFNEISRLFSDAECVAALAASPAAPTQETK